MGDSNLGNFDPAIVGKLNTAPESGIKEKKGSDVDPDAFRKALEQKKTDTDNRKRQENQLEESVTKSDDKQLSKEKPQEGKDPSPYSVQSSDSSSTKVPPKENKTEDKPTPKKQTVATTVDKETLESDDISLSIDKEDEIGRAHV